MSHDRDPNRPLQVDEMHQAFCRAVTDRVADPDAIATARSAVTTDLALAVGRDRRTEIWTTVHLAASGRLRYKAILHEQYTAYDIDVAEGLEGCRSALVVAWCIRRRPVGHPAPAAEQPEAGQ